MPKNVIVGMYTMQIGVHEAVLSFNWGNIGKCWVFLKLEINSGGYMIRGLRQCDQQRIQDAEKCATNLANKARKTSRRVKEKLENKLEAKENKSYWAGEF